MFLLPLKELTAAENLRSFAMLTSELRARKLEVVNTREPGGTTLGQKLRAALLDVKEQVDPLAELLVFAADRAHHVRTVLRPALAQNKIVISDRYADATAAYQGVGPRL